MSKREERRNNAREKGEEGERKREQEGSVRVRDRVRPIRRTMERGNDEDGTLFPPAQLARHALANADRRVSGIWTE